MFRDTHTLLRFALFADAAASAALGVVALAGAGVLAGPLGLPESLLRGVGLLLLPWAAFVAVIGMKPQPQAGAVRAIVGVNLAWAVASALALLALRPTALGLAFVIVQAVAVAALAETQWIGLSRARRAVAG